MKKLLLFFSAAFVCLGVSAQAEIQLEKKSHNFGTFKSTEIQKVVINFKNVGDQPLVIQKAFGSCGCTKPTFTEKAIAPGESGQITITYNPTNRRIGSFRGMVTIMANGKKPVERINLEGTSEK